MDVIKCEADRLGAATVRYAAVECLEAKGDIRAREPLLETLVSPEEDSARVDPQG